MHKNDDVLVVVAHFDDEVLGMGATIKRMTEKGTKVKVMVLSQGRTDDVFDEQKKVAKFLGYEIVRPSQRLKDQRFDEYSEIDINKIIEKEIKKHKPKIVFTHFHKDINKDHRIISNCVRVACRMRYDQDVQELYEFPVVSSTNYNTKVASFIADVYIPYTYKYSLKKTEAMKLYKSEASVDRSVNAIRDYDAYWGMSIGENYSEAFMTVVRKIIL